MYVAGDVDAIMAIKSLPESSYVILYAVNATIRTYINYKRPPLAIKVTILSDYMRVRTYNYIKCSL